MKVYPKYKPSGIEWIGDIPEHWELSRAKFVSTIFIPQRNKPDLNSEKGFPWLTMEDMLSNRIFKTSLRVNEESAQKAGSKILKKGSVIASCVGSFEVCAINEVDLIINQQLQAFIPNNILPEYLHAIVGISNDYFKMIATESTVVYVNQSGFANMPVLMIPISEQQQIIDFLDYKTGQCDRFIAKRQRQIELLNEQLHFKINQAITKGINSKVKFKPTDIKYVPEIPEHWDIRKFKSLTSILTCGVAATPEYVEESEGVAFLSAQNCRPFAMDLSKYNYIKPSLHKQLTRYKKPQRGDVLVTRVGAGIGQACIIDTDLEFSVYVSLTHIRPNKEILSEYIVYFFNTEYCYQLNHEGTVVAGGQGNLNVKNVERYRIPLPPIEEQKEIVTYLDNYRQEIDKLISKYQKQIDLMQEYQTALISQAVTGKIDVRDWQPNEKLKFDYNRAT